MNRWLRSLRVDEWGVQLLILWVVAAVYYGSSGAALAPYVRQVGLVSVWSAFILAGVYVLNDYFDRRQDIEKPRFERIAAERPAAALAVSIVFTAIGLLLAVMLAPNSWIKLVAAVQIAALVAYSAAGVRLKERGWLGILTPAVFQRIPAFLMVALAFPGAAHHAAALGIWLLTMGFLFIFEHQIEDWESDRRSGVRTWAVTAGRSRAARACRLSYGVFWGASAVAAENFASTARRPEAFGSAALLLATSAVFTVLLRRRYASNRSGLPRAEIANGRTGQR